MTTLISLAALILFASTFNFSEQCPINDGSPYPSELLNLKLYREAKWKAIQPYVSTKADVERILGEPTPIWDKVLNSYVSGYDYDPDWKLIVAYVGKGGDLPDSVVDRVDHIALYPKKRVSLTNIKFPAGFHRYSFTTSDPNVGGVVYYDDFGLRYSVSSKKSPDGLVHPGDLTRITYGASKESSDALSISPKFG